MFYVESIEPAAATRVAAWSGARSLLVRRFLMWGVLFAATLSNGEKMEPVEAEGHGGEGKGIGAEGEMALT